MNGLGYGTDGDSDSSVTRAGITGIAGNSGITTDNQAEYAGALENVFDETRVNEELGAQTIITRDFGKEAPKAVGDFANNRIKAIRADATLSDAEKAAAIAKWDEGGVYRIAAHTALGALGTGSLEGALTTGGVAAAAPTLNKAQANLAKALIDKGMSADIAEGTASGVISLALLGAGSAAGLDTSSTVMATNVDANNRQLHPSEIQFILDKDRVKRFADKYGLTEDEAKQLLSLNAAAMYDYNWMMAADEIGASNPAVRKFLKQEAINAGYPQLFNSDYITKEELSNPFLNLKTTFDAYSEGNKYVEDYINNVAIPVDNYLAQQLYKQGQKAGYASAGEGANIGTDLGTIIEGFKQLPGIAYDSVTSDEVGPIDSPRMKMYYDRLLRLQGNYYDAGFTSEKEFAEAQRLYWAGEMLGAAGGAATGQVARIVSKGDLPNATSQARQDAIQADIDNPPHIAVGDEPYIAPRNTTGEFQPHGVTVNDVPQSVRNIMEEDIRASGNPDPVDALKQYIESGKTVPVVKIANQDTKLYKLVQIGGDYDTPSPYTPYWIDQAQYDLVKAHPDRANDILGLPEGSQANSFSVFVMNPKAGEAPRVYQSSIAPTTNPSGVTNVGNATQTIVPNRTLWNEPTKTNDVIKVK